MVNTKNVPLILQPISEWPYPVPKCPTLFQAAPHRKALLHPVSTFLSPLGCVLSRSDLPSTFPTYPTPPRSLLSVLGSSCRILWTILNGLLGIILSLCKPREWEQGVRATGWGRRERDALNLWKLDNLGENILTRYIILHHIKVDFPNPSNVFQSYDISKIFLPL